MLAYSRRRVSLAAALVTAVVVSSAMGRTNLMSGSFNSDAIGYDYAGVYIDSIGGGIKWLSFATAECTTYGTESCWQTVSDLGWTPVPDELLTGTETWEDPDGDWKLVAYWGHINDPPGTVVQDTYGIWTSFDIVLSDYLDGLVSETPFPIPAGEIPSAIEDAYLVAGPLTQSDSPQIVSLADSLTGASESELSAVQRVVDWCVDNLQPWQPGVPPPDEQSALEVLQDPEHLATCQGYSHLAIALLRSQGIPARFAAGMRLPGIYYIPTSEGGSEEFNVGIERSRHGWVEVYYPQSGWIAYDVTWHLYHYIDTRNYKLCSGLDAVEAARDIRRYWFSAPPPMPSFSYRAASGSLVTLPDENGLSYVDTLATPQRLSLGDTSDDTGVDSAESQGTAAELRHTQSMPSPFSSSTRISFSTPAGGTHVTVSIYDPSGRLIRVLLNEDLDAGHHWTTWDGRDSQDKPVASGVYFYGIRRSDGYLGGKVILLK